MLRRTWTYLALIPVALSSWAEAAPRAERPGIEHSVAAWAQAADNNQTDEMEALLDDTFTTTIYMPGQVGVKSVDRSTYLQLLGDKRIGGDTRTLTHLQVDLVDDDVAMVRLQLVGTSAAFDAQHLWRWDGQRWRLLVEQLWFTPHVGAGKEKGPASQPASR